MSSMDLPEDVVENANEHLTHHEELHKEHNQRGTILRKSEHNKALHDALNIDADTVDGQHASAFALAHSHPYSPTSHHHDADYDDAGAAAAAVSSHESAGDPHSQYETSAEAQAKVNAHASAPDPHSQYLTGAKGDERYYPKGVGAVETAAATVAKSVAIPGYTLSPGDLLVLQFTNGNTANAPTLSVNGSAAAQIRVNNTALNSITRTLVAGAVVLLYWDGTYFHMAGSQRTSDSNTTYAVITEAEIDAGTAATARSLSGQRAAYIIGKSAPVGHDHSGDYDPVGAASGAVSSHEGATDPHAQYETAAEVSSKISSHESASNPHAQYETSAEAQAKVDAHANATDPHAQYLTQSEGDGRYVNETDLTKAAIDSLGVNADTVDGQHASAFAPAHNHPYSPASHNHDADYENAGAAAAAVSSHEGAGDPHSQYETSAEVNSKISSHESAANPHAQYETSAEAQAKVDAHANAADPHSQYLTQAEGDGRYVNETDLNKAAIDSLGVDADTVDGQDASAFATSGHEHPDGYGPWTNLSLQNSWSNFSAAWAGPVQYRTEPGGLVRLRGLVAPGTHGQFALLPSGIRPSYNQVFSANTGTTQTVRLDVTPSGYIAVHNYSITYASLSGIVYVID